MKDALAHQDNPIIGMGIFDKNPMRLDCEEAARLAGLDILINGVVNMWGETVALFAGDPQAAYAEAVREAKKTLSHPPCSGGKHCHCQHLHQGQ